MNRLNVIFIYFFCLFSTASFAQTNFLPGYYISMHSDTVRGYIDYKSERSNNAVCIFKKTPESKQVRLYPDQIEGFVVNEIDFYERHTYKTRRKAELFGFFRVIIKGKVSLLRFESDYFAMDASGKIFELSDKSVETEGGRRKDYYRIGIMKVLVSDCEELSGNLEQKYKSNDDLKDILREYYECQGLTYYQTETIKIAPAIRVGISTSVAYTTLSFNGEGFKNDFNSKIVPEIGPYFSIFIPRIGDRVRLLTEILYGQNNTYSFYSTDFVNNDFFAKYSYLRIPLFLRYEGSKIFFEGGLNTQVIISQELTWRRETFKSNTVYTDDPLTEELSPLSRGYIAGIGTKFYAGKIYIQPAIRFCQTFSPNSMYKPQFQNIELNLKLKLR